MIRVLSLFLCFVFSTVVSKAQLFGEKIYLFGIKFKAKEVTGQKRFNASDFLYKTAILDPLPSRETDAVFFSIGSYRKNKGIFEATDLFNMSFEVDPRPFLDLIDFDYYRNVGLNIAERRDPDLLNDENYKKIKSYLVDSTHLSIQDRKKILFSYPASLRNKIILSRYEIIRNPFTVDKKKVSKTTADFKAQLDTMKIDLNAELTAKVRAYLSRLADEATVIRGYYVDIRMHPSYIAKIEYYTAKAIQVEVGDDQFATNLKQYIASGTAAVNSGLVAVQLDGKFNKTRISIDSIQADLSGKLQIPANDVVKLSASINFAFTKNETTVFSNEFNNAHIIRYFTSKNIDDISFRKLEFSYQDGFMHGKNMGILVKKLEDYYQEKKVLPASLKDLNIKEVLDSLGNGKLSYLLRGNGSARLAFAGKDYVLNTTDDKVYEANEGLFRRVR